MTILDALKQFGLSEKEAKVYMGCLELGESSASEISVKTDLPRTLVYDILERLIDLGLVSYAIKNNKKFFQASDPDEFVTILKEKQRTITKAMPELKNLQKIVGIKRPKIRVYEGKEGMKTIMNDVLKLEKKEFIAYGSSGMSFDLMPYFMENWHRERVKKKIKLRLLFNDTKVARQRLKKFPKTFGSFDKIRFMPIKLASPTGTMLYANKVVLSVWSGEPFAIIVESKELRKIIKSILRHCGKLQRRNSKSFYLNPNHPLIRYSILNTNMLTF